MRPWGSFCLVALASCAPAANETSSNAVVSTSLCSDGYVHAFPDLEPRLKALSWQSRSALSMTPDHMKDLPQLDTNPERSFIWKDVIQISSAGGSGDIDLKWGEDFDTVWDNLGRLSTELNLEDPSQNLKSRLSSLKKSKKPTKVLYLNRSGATAGPGTFVDAVIKSTGAENVVTSPGWQSPDTEVLLQFDPDVILTSFMGSDYAGVNDRALRHDALAKKIAALPQIDIPGKYWPCAGPGLIDAAEQLSASLKTL